MIIDMVIIMLYIVDNGKGAKDISIHLRMKHEIVSPKKIKPNGSAYILTDGDIKNKADNVKFIKSAKIPVLGIGAGAAFIAASFDAPVKEGKCEKSKIVKVNKSCPLLLDFKKVFKAEDSCNVIIEDLPENIYPVASSQHYEFEIIQDMQNPFFGVHFNPTTPETFNILRNFEKFLGVWERFHK